MDTQPHYRRIAGLLTEEINVGKYPVGGALPTEHELSERFGVSRHTTREALRQIEHLGLITRRQGSGSTVVAITPPVRYEQSIQSIDDLMHQSSASRLQVLSCEDMAADADQFASQITLIGNARCIRVRSIRYLRNDVRPLALVDVYVAIRSTAQARRLRNPGTAAREIVATADPSKLDRIEQAFSAVNIAADHAKLLHVQPGDAAFQTVRNYFDLNTDLVIVAHSLYQGQLFTYTSTLRRNNIPRKGKLANT
jgi:GntR family transcriptional regulator